MVALADAKFVQIAGEAFDLLQGLRESPALAAFESREDVVRFGAGVAFQRVAQHADVGWIGALGHIGGRKRNLVVFCP